MAAGPTERTPDVYRPRLLPRPPVGARVQRDVRRGRRGWIRVALVVAFLAALAYATWQEGIAGEAQSRLATLSTRFGDLQADVVALREENEQLRGEIDGLREENERLAGEVAALRASADEEVDEQAVVALILPYLREQLGDSVGSLAEVVSLDQLGDLLARGWEQLAP